MQTFALRNTETGLFYEAQFSYETGGFEVGWTSDLRSATETHRDPESKRVDRALEAKQAAMVAFLTGQGFSVELVEK